MQSSTYECDASTHFRGWETLTGLGFFCDRHDHETDEEYAVMVKQEEELIAEFRRRMGEAGTGAASK